MDPTILGPVQAKVEPAGLVAVNDMFGVVQTSELSVVGTEGPSITVTAPLDEQAPDFTSTTYAWWLEASAFTVMNVGPAADSGPSTMARVERLVTVY